MTRVPLSDRSGEFNRKSTIKVVDSVNFWCVATKKGWIVKKEGLSAPIAVYKSKEKAWNAAKQFAKYARGTAYLQGLSGKIQFSDR